MKTIDGDKAIKQDIDIISGNVVEELEQLKIDITQAVNEYLDRLNLEKPEDITVAAFNGLCLYINSTVMATRHNADTQRGLPDGDLKIPSLYVLWDYYFNLCSIHNKTLSLVQFSMLCGTNTGTFYQWFSGSSRGKKNSEYQRFSQIVLQACESATYSRTVDNNSIGAMFALKSVYGYQEQQKQVIEIHNYGEQTPQEISAKYAPMLAKTDREILLLSDSLSDEQAAKNKDKKQVVFENVTT